MWTLLLACHGDDGRTRPPPTDGDHTGVPPTDTAVDLVTVEPVLDAGGPLVRLARRLTVETSVPTTASAVLDDGVRARRITWPVATTRHELPVLELHEATPYTLVLTLTAADGARSERTVTFATDPVDLLLPTLELLANDGAEPGLRVFPVGDASVPFLILAVDQEARPVYVLKTGGDTKAVTWHPDDGWWSQLQFGTVRRTSLFGEPLQSWAGERDLEDGDVPVAVRTLHHEVLFRPDGTFWSFHKRERLVPDYPVDLADLSVRAPTTIDDDHVILVAPDGSILRDFGLGDRLDPARVTADSLTENREGVFDWAHANGIAEVPGEDAILVSMRHQDAVAKLDATTGEVRWILANHDGWVESVRPLLLEPAGTPFAWQYHQHAPFPLPDGHLLVFDNGNAQRTTPYSDDPVTPSYTRLVEFAVDERARTVRQVAAYVEGVPEPLYADTLGNADRLPLTGHVFGTFSYLYRENGVDNASVGLGRRSVRLIEVDLAAGTKHWDLRMTASARDVPAGYQTDRATVVPTLYPDGVITAWLD